MSAQLEFGDSTGLSVDAVTPVEAKLAATETLPKNALRPIPDDALILLPVRANVLFPGTIIPFNIDRGVIEAGVQDAVRMERPIGVVLQREPRVADAGPENLHAVGTSASVLRYLTMPDETHRAVVRGLRRFRILGYLEDYPFLVARVQYVDEPATVTAEIEGRARALKQSAHETLQLLPHAPPEMAASLEGITDPSQLADVIAGLLDIAPEDKQALLETSM